MRAELEAIVEELKRRKAEGESTLYLADDTLAVLREQVDEARSGRSATPAAREEQPRAAAPSPRRSDEAEAPARHEYLDRRPQEATRGGRANDDGPGAEDILKQLAGTARPVPEAPVRPSTGEPAPIPAPTPFELPTGSKQERWEWLRERVLNCPVCNAHIKKDKKVVFGVGNLDAKIFFCGEAPGGDEEIEGEPFVGKAGQLLTKIIGAMGLTRQDVYIGNIMNWRPELPTPTGNRPPTQEEMAFCLPYLRAQIAVVQPQVIVALGNTAISGLLGPDPSRKLGQIRGTWLDFEGTPLMPTYHPSYVLRYGNNQTKRAIWEDMLAVMRKVDMPISDKQEAYFR